MKVQVEIHSNLDFEKATEKQLKRVMYRTILDIGRDAHKDVRKTFKTNTDITGKGFKTLNEKYEKSKFKNKNKILTLMGDLAQSIQMRTNEPNMTVSVGSTFIFLEREITLKENGFTQQTNLKLCLQAKKCFWVLQKEH
jgi:phage gpG-like protein